MKSKLVSSKIRAKEKLKTSEKKGSLNARCDT